MKEKYHNVINKLSLLKREEKLIIIVITGIILSLITAYLFSDKSYFTTSYDFANGIRISEDEYLESTKGGDYSSVFTKFNFNYLVFFCSLVIYLGILYLLFSKLQGTGIREDRNEEKPRKSISPVIQGIRDFALNNNTSLTTKTSDKKILEIHSIIGAEFGKIAKTKNDDLSQGNLNYIAFKFLEVYETLGKTGFESHLDYELNYYKNNDLREDYLKELNIK